MWVLYSLNVFCIVFSGMVAHRMFEQGNTKLGWGNLFASALNLAIVVDAILK